VQRVRSSVLAHGLWLVPFLVLAAPIVLSMWRKWTRSVWDNGHGLFVPFLVVFLAWTALRREPVKSEEPSRWGFPILVASALLMAIDAVIKTDDLRAFALILSLPGLSLLLLGPRRTRALRFPLLLAFFMLPLPPPLLTPLHLHLQGLTALGSEWFLHLLRLPVLAEGTYLHLPHGTLRVVMACSGFSALYAAITIALVLSYLSHSWKRRALLLSVAVPLALGGNVLRVSGLAILAEWWGYEILQTSAHVLSGYASFVLTLGVLFLFADHGPRRAEV
jgi:exosortase